MELIKLNQRGGVEKNEKLNLKYVQFNQLLIILRSRRLSDSVLTFINKDIDVLNKLEGSDKKYGKQMGVIQSRIIKLLEKEHKLVTKGHYRNTWLVLGMAAFGIPLGVAFGITMGNLGLLAIGLPIGIAIGIAVGMSMDNKALEEGRQLDIEIKY